MADTDKTEDGFDAGPFSMMAVSALENHIQTVEFAGKKYAAIEIPGPDGNLTPAMIFCRGLLGYNNRQELELRNGMRPEIIRAGDRIVMLSRTEYGVMRMSESESLFSLMPDVPLSTPEARLSRIAEAHQPNVGEGGLTDGLCRECNWSMPCPTRVWATKARDVLSTWDPADDEPDGILGDDEVD